jgi:hypothetical protein
MLIIDYSGIAIAPIVMGAAAANDENLIRHMILNTIRMYRSKYRNYGETVIVADGGGNWRKDVYPEYKGKRSSNRDESKIDWDAIFLNIGIVLKDIKENFPYKVIHQWGCEADDAIAELVHHTQEFGNFEDVMIISSDHDFKQLQKYSNVKQFSPLTKKLVKADDPVQFRLEHIVGGCKGDGVPNALSPDNTFVDEMRQVTLSANKKAALLEDPKSLGEEVYRNYLRNKKMISLVEDRQCPVSVRNEIISTFMSQDPSDNKKKVLPFLIEKKCRRLLEDVKEFIE